MMEMMQFEFMRRALLASVLVAAATGYFGPFVVQRGLGFLGSGLAHAAFGGVAVGLFLGVEPLWPAIAFTLLIAMGIVWVEHSSLLAGDTAIGVFFAVSMAFGIVLLARTQGFQGDAAGYLFGTILAVGAADLWGAAGACALALATLPLWGRWAYATVDRELAQADRVPVKLDDYLLAGALAVVVVVSLKIVGVVLAAAFLVVPAAAARLVCGRFGAMTVAAMAFGAATAAFGVVLSYQLDSPTGATIVLLQAAGFFVLLGIARARGR